MNMSLHRNIILKVLILVAALLTTNCKSGMRNDGGIDLENTTWLLSEVNGMPVITPAGMKDIEMRLTQENGENRIHGFAGCNGLGGNYTRTDDKVHFTVITTKMYCEERMSTENFLSQALHDANRFTIQGETLSLFKDDLFLAKFTAKK